jgi:prepilin-type N-terminal cleavage/methylation domain-containing protein
MAFEVLLELVAVPAGNQRTQFRYHIYLDRLPVVRAALQKMKTTRTKVGLAGFTLAEIMIVIAIISLLCAICIPTFVKARANSQANACINNLRQIDGAMQQFAIEKNKHIGDAVNYPTDLTPYLKMNSANSIPACPASGNYSVLPIGTEPSVSCSLGSLVTPSHTF